MEWRKESNISVPRQIRIPSDIFVRPRIFARSHFARWWLSRRSRFHCSPLEEAGGPDRAAVVYSEEIVEIRPRDELIRQPEGPTLGDPYPGYIQIKVTFGRSELSKPGRRTFRLSRSVANVDPRGEQKRPSPISCTNVRDRLEPPSASHN